MYGSHRHFRPRGPQNPNIPFLQNPNHSFFQNPNLSSPSLSYNPYLQNSNFAPPTLPFSLQAPRQPHHPSPSPKPNEFLEKIERAVGKAHRDLLAAGESVSAWKVSQSALLALQSDSWSSLGFQFQEIPSLHRLIVIEGKVNAFIHCFVGVRRITSVYDLEVAICKSEGIDLFEELGMGPLLQHPLVEHYFLVPSDATEIYKITSEEIISCLADFMETCADKDIRVECFLDFLAKKQSVAVRERLGVRIQSLGMHITSIREARKAENATLQRYLQALRKTAKGRIGKYEADLLLRHGILSQKQGLDRRFDAISERVKSFSSECKKFSGKHIRFISSSSEDESSNDSDSEEENANGNVSNGHQGKLSQNRNCSGQRVSSCPYPSANEERARLGLTVEMDECASRCNLKNSDGKKSSVKKRKCEMQSGNLSSSHKVQRVDVVDVDHLHRKDELLSSCRKIKKKLEDSQEKEQDHQSLSLLSREHEGHGKLGKKSHRHSVGASREVKCQSQGSVHDDQEKVADLVVTRDQTEKFIATWKETCREFPVVEVFCRMANFYKATPRQIKKMEEIFSSYPGIGLLNVAVTSIKRGMWDSLYDTFLDIGEPGFASTSSSQPSEMIDIDPSTKKDAKPTNNDHIAKIGQTVNVDNIIEEVAAYFELGHVILSHGKLPLEKQFVSFGKFHDCEMWLIKQFSVKKFGDLGHGDFLEFMDRHVFLFPDELHKGLNGKVQVEMLENQLQLLLSQAMGDFWDSVGITRQHISALLKKQFPLISFEINGCESHDYSDLVKNQKSCDSSSCVLFSVALLGECLLEDSLTYKEKNSSQIAEMITVLGQSSGSLGAVSRKDALECLVKAPMLSDLQSWSHWDLIFAPSFGPLLEWLLREVHTKELLCLATKDGKLIRLDHSATVDEFLEASLQGSSFQTAVKLLSLLSLYGGTHHVPLSLLKCYAHRGIEVILKNSISRFGVKNNGESCIHGGQIMLGMVSDRNLCLDASHGTAADARENDDLVKHLFQMNKATAVASKFILNCLAYLPSEFRSFAADILLSGLRDFTKDAAAVILSECYETDQRVMLHDIGFTLGIMEWIEDYHAFSSATDVKSSGSLTKISDTFSPSCSIDSRHTRATSENFLAIDGKKVTVEVNTDIFNGHHETSTEIPDSKVLNQALNEKAGFVDGCDRPWSKDSREKDAALIIESIRCEEFGLDPNLKFSESNLLKRQHARLGRALHCLSQELYSQDSHFLLELVQNADDNIYPQNVEPTLVFILQATGIVVLNNEQGFSAQNIRALCDIGNSTKKGLGGGYIGQKGIGFKSVFRVTDAPEIHSNGFHVKFDASEGQIGFVLPTVIPPCDINLFTRQISSEADEPDTNRWNTCIVLPFRSKLKEGTAMNSVLSMFSDLHPSLLLFLHRLQCIKFRNMSNNSLIIMKRESVGDGIVKVSHGKEKMSWLVAKKKLEASAIRPAVQGTEIAIAFTLQKSSNGVYRPHLEQQPVFAFLPLRTYGLKFIVQGDFVLPSAREEVDANSAWNQWLLSEFPALFISAKELFCSLPCFNESPGKAVTAFMSFVPLVGEVHGFFSHLPHMIISKLRMSNCLLLEGHKKEWVPPCRVLRGWNEQARVLLPESLLHQHLGLGYLNNDITLSDALARALGLQDYGPKILTDFISSMCHVNNGIKSLGLDWLSSWLCALYATLSVHSSGHHTLNPALECDLINSLRKIPFVPLSDGSYGSLAEGPIWLPCDAFSVGPDGEHNPNDYPNLYAKLRTVNPELFSVVDVNACGTGEIRVDTLTRVLLRIGVQRLSAHQVIKNHILPAMSDGKIADNDSLLMAEYLSFVMLHLQSACVSCNIERTEIILELQKKAVILTGNGYKCPLEDSIHFSKVFGNPVDVSKLIGDIDSGWHEVDPIYLKHSITQSLPFGLTKWREFLQKLGVTDFVQVVHVVKKGTDVPHAILQNMTWDGDLSSAMPIIEDWESPELVWLISTLSSKNCGEKCKYLLEVLDKMWDDHFCEKVTGYCAFNSEDRKPFESTFMNSIRNFSWIASSVDAELHHPKDVFYDCDGVRSILGDFAPYAVPQVRSKKFLSDVGFKTQVTIDDALKILQKWKTCTHPFRASIAQMSRFYGFISDGMATQRGKVVEEFRSGPSIFVPFSGRTKHGDVVTGMFVSPDEVYWHDPTGCVDRTKELVPECSLINESGCLPSKTLADIYPNLRDFFVNEFGVHKVPSFHGYLQILLQLSSISLPSQAANAVFRVLLKWADDLKSGLLESEEIASLKECLLKLESTVLPTEQDKWVSLHPSFGLVCWSDDEEIRKEFKHSNNIDFLYFGELNCEENEMLPAKLSVLMQTLGIPALSEVVSREAIFYGTEDSREKASLVDWILPFAQRYLYKLHPDIYFNLKEFQFESLSQLQVIVVDKLFYKPAIKRCDAASKKRFECNSLLQGNTLYVAQSSDSHSIFLELSRLFFKGSAELHLANFLHMITTMAESGSTEEQIEFFIIHNQKVPKLPDGEQIWSLSCVPSSLDEGPQVCATLMTAGENTSKSKHKPGINSNWPPTDWKTAPDFRFAQANHFRTRPVITKSDNSQVKTHEPKSVTCSEEWPVPVEICGNWIVPSDSLSTMVLALQDPRNKRNEPLLVGNSGGADKQMNDKQMNCSLELQSRLSDSGALTDRDLRSSAFSARDQLCLSMPNKDQAFTTGRLGELVAYSYFVEKVGLEAVRWINEEMETGLPYDIVIGKNDESREYVEVKATRSLNKDWFTISTREWQFAAERGNSFSIAHVVLADPKNAKITVFKNPVRLCQQDMLHLVILMPRQQKEPPAVT